MAPFPQKMAKMYPLLADFDQLSSETPYFVLYPGSSCLQAFDGPLEVKNEKYVHQFRQCLHLYGTFIDRGST